MDVEVQSLQQLLRTLRLFVHKTRSHRACWRTCRMLLHVTERETFTKSSSPHAHYVHYNLCVNLYFCSRASLPVIYQRQWIFSRTRALCSLLFSCSAQQSHYLLGFTGWRWGSGRGRGGCWWDGRSALLGLAIGSVGGGGWQVLQLLEECLNLKLIVHGALLQATLHGLQLLFTPVTQNSWRKWHKYTLNRGLEQGYRPICGDNWLYYKLQYSIRTTLSEVEAMWLLYFGLIFMIVLHFYNHLKPHYALSPLDSWTCIFWQAQG